MKRRLYFLLPDAAHARAVVNELMASGIRYNAMHVVAKPGLETGDLPVATSRQREDIGGRLETAVWDGNLALFFAALLALAGLFLLEVHWTWLLVPVAVMLATFTAGLVFTARIPNVHLSEFTDAIHHGELLLMVDVPVWQVSYVESLVHRHHPEAVAGGVGWHLDILHV
jgi:hypothetical protein